MRVLTVCRELPPIGGGAGYVAINLATELAGRGHHVELISMRFGDLPAIEHTGGVTIHRVEVGRRDADSSRTPEMARFVVGARRLARRLANNDTFDVAHAHAIIPDGLVLGAACAKRTVVTAHGSDVPGYNPDKFQVLHSVLGPWWRRAAARPTVVTAPSRHLAGLIATAGANRPVTLVPNGIDLDLFRPQPRERSVLVVTRLVRRKNVHLLLEALTEISTPITVNIVGDGPERPMLEAAASKLTHHSITFHGWLDHGSPEWRRLYETSRFFVFPSSSENFPINLLEAQLAGLVTIASDIPGNREVLGEAARYLESLDGRSLARSLAAALDTPDEQLEAEAQAATRRVRHHFSWIAVADAFETIYTDE